MQQPHCSLSNQTAACISAVADGPRKYYACEECQEGHILKVDGNCDTECPDKQYGAVNTDVECRWCSDSNCKTCPEDTCNVCLDDFIVTYKTGNCTTECPPGEYGDPGDHDKCIACGDYCVACDNQVQNCTTCSAGSIKTPSQKCDRCQWQIAEYEDIATTGTPTLFNLSRIARTGEVLSAKLNGSPHFAGDFGSRLDAHVSSISVQLPTGPNASEFEIFSSYAHPYQVEAAANCISEDVQQVLPTRLSPQPNINTNTAPREVCLPTPAVVQSPRCSVSALACVCPWVHHRACSATATSQQHRLTAGLLVIAVQKGAFLRLTGPLAIWTRYILSVVRQATPNSIVAIGSLKQWATRAHTTLLSTPMVRRARHPMSHNCFVVPARICPVQYRPHFDLGVAAERRRSNRQFVVCRSSCHNATPALRVCFQRRQHRLGIHVSAAGEQQRLLGRQHVGSDIHNPAWD